MRTIVLEKAGAAVITFDLRDSFNWYDITVAIKGNSLFEKRYAGRVETCKPGKSDPFMGKQL
ncbi:hypothetical protein FW778_21195 [Ginsengibacter hankyongi]|uniref:Uncharacterized protein n=1 Tax=Ginsengibacter hankyongi TaxID=2607284 RepID=A0A5J5ICR5_9BACT|nr:hypothetical protein [Ginsengibacter hankyongi]KAA9035478.1 hypothetical protein FW778_21195 [Ginsengibacter hankyongi]